MRERVLFLVNEERGSAHDALDALRVVLAAFEKVENGIVCAPVGLIELSDSYARNIALLVPVLEGCDVLVCFDAVVAGH